MPFSPIIQIYNCKCRFTSRSGIQEFNLFLVIHIFLLLSQIVKCQIIIFITAFHRSQNWSKAVYWLDKVINTTTQDEEGNFDGTMNDPQYQLVARQAQMYLTGGHSLERDPNKAGK